MADPVLPADGQQPNGQTSPFSPCRPGGGAPLAESPPPDPELPPKEEPLRGRWLAREAVSQGVSPGSGEDGCPPGEGRGVSPPGTDGQASARPAGAGGEGAAGLQAGGGGGGGSCGGERQFGKKKHRRRPSKKKRHWKPYYKLTWEEKKKFDEKQSQRASRLRAEMFAKGQPVAPYNTTQFLMEDHDQEEPDLKTGLCPKRAAAAAAAAAKSDDTGSEEDFVEDEDGGSDGMGGDGSEFLQKDFSETYERYHVESLQNMSKQELIKEYLELEKCLSRMEEENNRLRMESKGLGGREEEEEEEGGRVRQLEQELDRLRAENQKLLKENQLGRQQEKLLAKAGE